MRKLLALFVVLVVVSEVITLVRLHQQSEELKSIVSTCLSLERGESDLANRMVKHGEKW